MSGPVMLLRRGFAALAFTWLIAADAQSQTLQQDASPGKHLGVASCASTLCHGSARALSALDVQQNEYVTWSHFDPHARAYSVLLEERGRNIAARLGLKNAAEAPECLACHSDSVAAADRGERFQISDGIGCEACHGGGEGWIATHYDGPAVTHADNVKRGLRALESPKTRAETCMGCHVGDATRFATHRMMAAGHPRLAFELDTYTELWRTAGGREHYQRDRDYLERKGAFSTVEVWLTGLAVATRRTSGLVEQRMHGAQEGFPDFALYNCYSCHRSMKLEAWDGGSHDDGPPGSLKVQDGHARALLAVLDAVDPAQAAPLRQALNTLQAAAAGNSSSVHDANRAIQGALASVERRDLRREWSRGYIDSSLDALVSAAKRGAFADYASAEQAAMGMVLLLSELDANDVRAREVEELFRTLQDDGRFDKAKFARALSVLSSRQPSR